MNPDAATLGELTRRTQTVLEGLRRLARCHDVVSHADVERELTATEQAMGVFAEHLQHEAMQRALRDRPEPATREDPPSRLYLTDSRGRPFVRVVCSRCGKIWDRQQDSAKVTRCPMCQEATELERKRRVVA